MVIDTIKDTLILALYDSIKFCFGFIFGAFIWIVIVLPFTIYYDFLFGHYWPEIVFSATAGLLFMAFKWARCTMVLFFPGMLGTTTQNYIIVLLVSSLLANPLANIGSNAIESVRVIGCSLTLAFEQLKDRAKVLLNPLLVLFENEEQQGKDLDVIREHLIGIKETIAQMSDRLRVDSYEKVANVSVDTEELRLKSSINIMELEKLLGSKNQSYIDDLRAGMAMNFTDLMYHSCLQIFVSAKKGCQATVESMRASCESKLNIMMSSVVCPPLFGSTKLICPTLMHEVLHEDTMCKQMENSSLWRIDRIVDINNRTLTLDKQGKNFTASKFLSDIRDGKKNASVNEAYVELNLFVNQLDQDIYANVSSANETQRAQLERIEISVGLNNKTKEIFMEGRKLVEYIQDKYRYRKFFLKFLLFLYDLYTAYTFYAIITGAWYYRKSYLNDIKFDNVYITQEFKSMDEKKRGKSKILPLSMEESRKYIHPYSYERHTTEESKILESSVTAIVTFLATTLSLMYMDDIFYSILKSIRRHALIRYHEMGHHDLWFNVYGDGSLANIIRRLLSQLNSLYKLDKTIATSRCLPKPEATSKSFYLYFACLVILYAAIEQISIFALRLRRYTCAYFYPEHELRRLIYLRQLILYQRTRLYNNSDPLISN